VTNPADIETIKADPDFQESNQMHSINGYSFGNLTTLTMKKGERVRWYMMGMETKVDVHTPY
jgi:hephaestin